MIPAYERKVGDSAQHRKSEGSATALEESHSPSRKQDHVGTAAPHALSAASKGLTRQRQPPSSLSDFT